VLPLGLKPPFIPLFVLALAVGELILVRRQHGARNGRYST
jgi:hypothetical protein